MKSVIGSLALSSLLFYVGEASAQQSGICPPAGSTRSGDAASPLPAFRKGAPVVEVPYARTPDFRYLTGLHVRLSVNGGPPQTFLIDTGSTGIVMPADEVPGFNGTGDSDELTYSSSGLRQEGVRALADVSLPDARTSDGKPVVAHMTVLAVTRRSCTGKGTNAAHCVPDGRSHMLGIGFGRGPDGTSTQSRNLFVMLNAMQAGTMHRGYILGRKGIQLGLSAETVMTGFIFQKLAARSAPANQPSDFTWPRDYVAATGSFQVDDLRSGPGTVLIDTGLTNMMLADPAGEHHGNVPAASSVRIDLLDGRLSYCFKVGDSADAAVPRRVSWVRPTHGAFVNTGLRALARFDYLYDADGGFLGLRPVDP